MSHLKPHEKSWRLLKPNGEVRFNAVTLSTDGRIIGCNHHYESFWTWDGEHLSFLDASMSVTAISSEVIYEEAKPVKILMVQPTNLKALYLALVERETIFECAPTSVIEDVNAVIKRHPAFSTHPLIGRNGFSLPSIEQLEVIQISESTLPRLRDLGIEATGVVGNTNTIAVDASMQKIKLNIQFNNRTRNLVVLDKESRLRGSLNFSGDENIAVIGRGYADNVVSCTFRYHAAGLFLGCGCSSPGTSYWIEGPNKSIVVGDDFMFSWSVGISTADTHALIDLDLGEVVNSSRSICIGPHVWLGQDVLIMPGVEVGAGSVIGARAVVTKSVPSASVAVGTPARVVRQRASWTRSANPSGEMIDELRTNLLRHARTAAELSKGSAI